jgi:hypothetical protein
MSISIINSIQPSAANQTIQGSAVGADSSVLANSYVMLVRPTNQSSNNFVLQPIRITTTDAEGNFRFDNLPPGEYQTIVEQTPASAAPAAYLDPDAVSPQISDNYVVLNDDLSSETKPKIRNDHIGSLIGLPVVGFAGGMWTEPPTITVLGNCTIPAQVRCKTITVPGIMTAPGVYEPNFHYVVTQIVIENPGQGYSVYGTDGNLGTEGSLNWIISGSYYDQFPNDGISTDNISIDTQYVRANDFFSISSIQTNGAQEPNPALPEGSDSGWPYLATEPGDFNRWVSIYASNGRRVGPTTCSVITFDGTMPWTRRGGWYRTESIMVIHAQVWPDGQDEQGTTIYVPITPTCAETPIPLIRPYTLQNQDPGTASSDITQANSSTLPDLQQNYGLAQFLNGLQKVFAQGIAAAAEDITGKVGGTALYYDMMYGANDSVQEALRAGVFGPPNSAEARVAVNELKGYLGKEFLVRPVFLSGDVQNFLESAQTFNANARVQAGLGAGFNESIVTLASVVANALYQGLQAIDNTLSGVTPNLYNSVSREWRGLKQQNWGAAQTAPPSWLVDKSFQSSLSTGQTVTYTFNSSGYNRTVSP